MAIDFERVVSDSLGSGWSIVSTNAEVGTYIASRRDLATSGFTCNLVLQVLPSIGDFDLASTVPTGAVTLSQQGLSGAVGGSAQVLLVDVSHNVSITQWIAYRFGTAETSRLVLSATTSDWPAVAGAVAGLVGSDDWSAT